MGDVALAQDLVQAASLRSEQGATEEVKIRDVEV